jgi:DNA polymerase-3 subunit delta
MKILAKTIDKFIASSINNVDSVLLYGSDYGLAHERKKNIINNILGKSFNDLNYVALDANQIKKDEQILENEINSISLFQERKLIIVDNCPTNFGKIVEKALKNKKSDNFVVFVAGELPPSSSLRKLFESLDNLAALPCYIDDKFSVMNLLKDSFKDKNINNEVIDYIASNISGDRLLIRNEIKKLKIFFHDKREINYDDVVNLLFTNIDADYQNFANEFMNKNYSKAILICDELIASGEQEITLIRVLSNYVHRVYNVKINMEYGQNFAEAIKSLKPPIFFKQKDYLAFHLNNWNISSLKSLLVKIDNLEKSIKTNSLISSVNFLRFFILLLTAK